MQLTWTKIWIKINYYNKCQYTIRTICIILLQQWQYLYETNRVTITSILSDSTPTRHLLVLHSPHPFLPKWTKPDCSTLSKQSTDNRFVGEIDFLDFVGEEKKSQLMTDTCTYNSAGNWEHNNIYFYQLHVIP